MKSFRHGRTRPNGGGKYWLSARVFACLLVFFTALTGISFASDMVSEFMCPCKDLCGKALEVCECSDAAGYIREIRDLESAGVSPQGIRDKFVEKYGPQVMASPPTGGFGLLAYVLPPLAVVFGVVVVLALVFRRRRGDVKLSQVNSGDIKKAEDILKKWNS